MDLRVWPLLVLVLVLLMPTCGGEVQVKKAAGVGPAVAKVAANLKRGAEEKIDLVKRSLSHLLAHRLTAAADMLHGRRVVGGPDDIRVRTRREIRYFLDSLQPHQLVRLRRAVALTKLNKQAKHEAKVVQPVPK